MKALNVVTALVVLAAPLATNAGFKATDRVTTTYYASTGTANGGIGYTRNTASTTSYFGCYTVASAGSATAYCYANPATGDGNYASCYSSNADIVKTVRSLRSLDSYFLFVYNASGQCTSVTVANGSYEDVGQP